MYLHSSPHKLNKTHIGASSGFLTKVVITQDKMSSRLSFNEMSNFSPDTKLRHTPGLEVFTITEKATSKTLLRHCHCAKRNTVSRHEIGMPMQLL